MAPPKTPNAPRGTVRGSSSGEQVAFQIRALPLPAEITDFLLNNASVLRGLQHELMIKSNEDSTGDRVTEETAHLQDDVVRTATVRSDHYWTGLEEVCAKLGGEWTKLADTMWASGPQGAGGCVLVDARKQDIANS